MNTHSSELLKELESIIASKTVIGETINVDGVLIVPFIDVSIGIGSGGGGKKEEIGESPYGVGAGVSLEPSAVLVINNNTVQLVNIKNQDSLNKIIDMVPNILSKFGLDKKKDDSREDVEGDNEDEEDGIQ